MARLIWVAALTAATGLGCPASAHADEADAGADAAPASVAIMAAEEAPSRPLPPPDAPAPLPRLHVNPWLASIVAGWGWTFWITTEALRPTLASQYCRWCDRDANGNDTLNSFDKNVRKAVKWYDTAGAAWASDISAFVVLPLLSAGTLAYLEYDQDGFRHAFEDAVIIAEAGAVAAVAGQVMKYTTARARPYAHARAGGEYVPGYGITYVPDDNLSFYSGHATYTFCLATAAGTVASMRGFKGAGWVWAGGLATAALTSYLRVAADRHYATDVLTGAALGTAIGFAFPYFLHKPYFPGTDLRAFGAPVQGGATLHLRGTW
jgi:membrane-associated phospholipid phosphatase